MKFQNTAKESLFSASQVIQKPYRFPSKSTCTLYPRLSFPKLAVTFIRLFQLCGSCWNVQLFCIIQCVRHRHNFQVLFSVQTLTLLLYSILTFLIIAQNCTSEDVCNDSYSFVALTHADTLQRRLRYRNHSHWLQDSYSPISSGTVVKAIIDLVRYKIPSRPPPRRSYVQISLLRLSVELATEDTQMREEGNVWFTSVRRVITLVRLSAIERASHNITKAVY